MMLVIFDHITVILSIDAFLSPRKYDVGDEASNFLKSIFLGKSGTFLKILVCVFYRFLIQSTKYYHVRIIRVWNTQNQHFSCRNSNILIFAPTIRFFVKSGSLYHRKLSIDLADFQWHTSANTRVPYVQIWTKLDQIATVRVPPEKNAKWPPWRYLIEILKIWEKKNTGPCPGDYLCEVSSKSAQPFRL